MTGRGEKIDHPLMRVCACDVTFARDGTRAPPLVVYAPVDRLATYLRHSASVSSDLRHNMIPQTSAPPDHLLYSLTRSKTAT